MVITLIQRLSQLDQLNGEKFDVIVSLKAMHHIPDPLQCVKLLVLCIYPSQFHRRTI